MELGSSLFHLFEFLFVQRYHVSMTSYLKPFTLSLLICCGIPALYAQMHPLELQPEVHTPLRFIVYGDTRFTDPQNTAAADPAIRQEMVRAIAGQHPAFVVIGGDIAYKGDNPGDWKVWEMETAVWRLNHIPVYPALGNHDLAGTTSVALANFFQHFPELENNRYYSLRAANVLLIILDSSLEETSGPQGEWLTDKLNHLAPEIDFVMVVLHHPPYTSSSESLLFKGGHSARPDEKSLARMLEERQQHLRARLIVFASHVHNYEHHAHGGISYFVTGGGGAHPYHIERTADDLFAGAEINYHYLLVKIDGRTATVVMNRVEFQNEKAVWSQPDLVNLTPFGEAPSKIFPSQVPVSR